MSIYLLLESIGFDTGISDGVAKIRAATLLGEILLLHQHTKPPLNYIHTNSKYGNCVAIPDSDIQESFSRAARDKGWVDKTFLHSSGGRWPWNNTCKSIYLINTNMKQFLTLLNVGCL